MPIHDKSPRPQEFAAVDLGSNSFHMVIARVVDGAMQIIGRLKQRVHLADGLGPDNMLSEEAMTRGLNCLSLFAERLQGFSPASVCIVGTHTLRQALNATDFLKRAEKVIPYPIEIISGNEEARLIFMGVEHTQPEKGRKLVIEKRQRQSWRFNYGGITRRQRSPAAADVDHPATRRFRAFSDDHRQTS